MFWIMSKEKWVLARVNMGNKRVSISQWLNYSISSFIYISVYTKWKRHSSMLFHQDNRGSSLLLWSMYIYPNTWQKFTHRWGESPISPSSLELSTNPLFSLRYPQNIDHDFVYPKICYSELLDRNRYFFNICFGAKHKQTIQIIMLKHVVLTTQSD